MKSTFIIIATLLFATTFFSQDNAYKIFTGKGKKSSYKKMSKSLLNANVVFFGELHNNPIAHWYELELAKFFATNKSTTFGAEMFEADDQQHLNNFMKGDMKIKTFDSLSKGNWPNFETDYLPVVEFAMQNKLKFIATNIPRKYASIVFKKGLEGLDTLPANEKSWIAPLPILFDIEVPCYKEMLTMMPGHTGENFPKAQAIKDATMAHFIKENATIDNNSIFFHLNGSYHSDNKEGIAWYLKKYIPNVVIMNITVVSQKDVNKLEAEHLGKADFIIVVDEDMTTTY